MKNCISLCIVLTGSFKTPMDDLLLTNVLKPVSTILDVFGRKPAKEKDLLSPQVKQRRLSQTRSRSRSPSTRNSDPVLKVTEERKEHYSVCLGPELNLWQEHVTACHPLYKGMPMTSETLSTDQTNIDLVADCRYHPS